MKFRLAKTMAREFSVAEIEEQITEDMQPEFKLNKLDVNVRVSEESKRNYAISFNIEAHLKGNDSVLVKVDYWAFFEAESDLTDEFLNSHFISINAPAIAYPYLRSFVTNVLVSAGYPAFYLPTVNFAALHSRKAESMKSK